MNMIVHAMNWDGIKYCKLIVNLVKCYKRSNRTPPHQTPPGGDCLGDFFFRGDTAWF